VYKRRGHKLRGELIVLVKIGIYRGSYWYFNKFNESSCRCEILGKGVRTNGKKNIKLNKFIKLI